MVPCGRCGLVHPPNTGGSGDCPTAFDGPTAAPTGIAPPTGSPPSSEAAPETAPRTRIDRYDLLGFLGQGGFGAVYRARHVHTRQIVAVKVVRWSPETELLAQSLLREAQTAASLGHPNIVRVVDCGVTPEHEVFLVMELVPGKSLDDVLAAEGPLPISRAVDIVLQTASGLEAAHERGIVHRDVKPANLLVSTMLDPAGGTRDHVTIVDFGVSKFFAIGSMGTKGALGTPGYMAPEQFTDPARADGRADVYSMAVVLFEMLCGRRPFEATTFPELMEKVTTTRAPSLASVAPHVPRELASAVDRALARDPDARFPTARAFAQALRTALGWPADSGRSPLRSPPLTSNAPPQYPSAPPQYPSAPPQYPSAPPQYPSAAPHAPPQVAPHGAPTQAGPTLGAALLPAQAPTRPPPPSRAPLVIALVGAGALLAILLLGVGGGVVYWKTRAAAATTAATDGDDEGARPEKHDKQPGGPASPAANTAAAFFRGEGVTLYEPELIGGGNPAAYRVLAQRSVHALAACRVSGRDTDVVVELMVDKSHGISSAEPDAENEGDKTAAQCVASALEAAAPKPWSEIAGSPIITAKVGLARRDASTP
ncbi:MAG: protein kinase, partial [Myxococcales bacterium]|nr:protein kinase [Myxococcales bacterium]